VTDIKKELYHNGPLIANFTIYEDFYSYYGGIYHHVAGERVGEHTVRVIGWGKELGLNYWLCANSWGMYWG
jgi:cathepsin B